MANLVITPSGKSAITYGPLSSANTVGYFYRKHPVEYSADYPGDQWAIPGRNGVGIVRHGFRGRVLRCFVRYVAATVNGLRGLYPTDADNMSNRANTVAFPDGASYSYCELVSFDPGIIYANGRGVFAVDCEIVFRQLRTS
jgi:hypothetical protein